MLGQSFRAGKIGVTSGAGTALYALERGMVANVKNHGRTGYGGVTHAIETAIYLDLSGEISYDLIRTNLTGSPMSDQHRKKHP